MHDRVHIKPIHDPFYYLQGQGLLRLEFAYLSSSTTSGDISSQAGLSTLQHTGTFAKPLQRAMSGQDEHIDDGFTSITWDQPPTSHHAPAGIFANDERPPLPESVPSSVDRAESRPMAMEGASREGEHSVPSWGGKWMAIEVREPVKEHEGSKEMYVSYAVRTRVSVHHEVESRRLTDFWPDESRWVPHYSGHR